jgi:hypothetical protein
MEGSLRDIAGRTTLSKRPFFYDKTKIWSAAEAYTEAGLMTPFTLNSTDLRNGLPDLVEGYTLPNPDRVRVAHIDLGLTGDACGLAVAHVHDVVTVKSRGRDGGLLVEDLPVVAYDV